MRENVFAPKLSIKILNFLKLLVDYRKVALLSPSTFRCRRFFSLDLREELSMIPER